MRWLDTAKHVSPLSCSTSHFSLMYLSDVAASSTEKWSPQQASSTPSYPSRLASGASLARGRSAHWPVKRVTERGMAKPRQEGGELRVNGCGWRERIRRGSGG